MKTRNISLTLMKAKEWYNSDSAELKEIALQAYTEEELTVSEWYNIKTFWDAVWALDLTKTRVLTAINNIQCMEVNSYVKRHLIAVYELDIIRMALNKGWNPKMTKGTIYYPNVRFYIAGAESREAAENNDWEVKEIFKTDGKKYSLVGGDCNSYYGTGISIFGQRYGSICPNVSLLCCKSKEIAQHMSRYFAKEIFEACYAHHVGTYEWV